MDATPDLASYDQALNYAEEKMMEAEKAKLKAISDAEAARKACEESNMEHTKTVSTTQNAYEDAKKAREDAVSAKKKAEEDAAAAAKAS